MKLARQLLRVVTRHEFWLELFLSVWPFLLLVFTVWYVANVVGGTYPWWGDVLIGSSYVLSWGFVLRGYGARRRIEREHRRRRANHPSGTSGGPGPLVRSRRSGARGGDGPGVVPDSGVPVTGCRTWNVAFVGSRIRLTSLTRPEEWPARYRMEARCISPHTGDKSTEGMGAPAEGCSCGIYAGKHSEVVVGTVIGWVSLWGKVIEHEHGYRGQFAYPERLIVVGMTGQDLRARSIANRLASEYGVPVQVQQMDAVFVE